MREAAGGEPSDEVLLEDRALARFEPSAVNDEHDPVTERVRAQDER